MIVGKLPSPPLGNTPESIWHRALVKYLADVVLRDVVGGKIVPHAAGGFSIEVARQVSAGGEEGWHYHSTKEYDPETSYAINEAVIVSPHNLANLDGINNDIELATGGALVGLDGFGPDQDHATAGTWVCVKAPKVLHATQPEAEEDPRNYNVHVPAWIPPDGDPDSPNNYWLLIGLYPITMNLCINGVNVPYYCQAQPVPEEFLLGEGGEAMEGEGGENIISES